MERPLARAHAVRMIGLQGEARTAVLQADPRTGNHDARAEAHVVRLDQRHHHAAGVRRRKVNRPGLRRHAVLEVLRALAIDQPRSCREICRLEHLRRGNLHRPRVGDVTINVGKRELHRFDLEVLRFRRIHPLGAEVEPFENPERDQRGDALAVRGDFMHGIAAIIERERLHPVVHVRREVFQRVRAAVRPRMCDHLLRQLAAIECFALGRGDLFQRRSQRGRGEELARLRRAAARQEMLGEAGNVPEYRYRLRPLVGDDRAHRIAIARVADGRREKVGER